MVSMSAASVVDLPLPVGNQPVHRADGAALVEHVAAEPRQAADAEGEVQFLRLLEALFLRVGEDAVGQRLGLGRRQRCTRQPLEVAVHAHLWRCVGGQMQVRPIHLDRHPE